MTSTADDNPYTWDVDLTMVTLANFNYRTLSLVRDYDTLLTEPMPNAAFDELFSTAPRDVAPAAATIPMTDRYLVVPADASQLAAVAQARSGDNFVIQGPPGTGKSQTITNLVADFVAHGKRVLFVCQKRAALDVVHARLRAQGLDEICTLVHDSQEDKKEFVHGLRATYERWLADDEPLEAVEARRSALDRRDDRRAGGGRAVRGGARRRRRRRVRAGGARAAGGAARRRGGVRALARSSRPCFPSRATGCPRGRWSTRWWAPSRVPAAPPVARPHPGPAARPRGARPAARRRRRRAARPSEAVQALDAVLAVLRRGRSGGRRRRPDRGRRRRRRADARRPRPAGRSAGWARRSTPRSREARRLRGRRPAAWRETEAAADAADRGGRRAGASRCRARRRAPRPWRSRGAGRRRSGSSSTAAGAGCGAGRVPASTPATARSGPPAVQALELLVARYDTAAAGGRPVAGARA